LKGYRLFYWKKNLGLPEQIYLGGAVGFSACSGGYAALRCTCVSPAIAWSVGGLHFGAASVRQPFISYFSIQLFLILPWLVSS
jgi:hypothetical protein